MNSIPSDSDDQPHTHKTLHAPGKFFLATPLQPATTVANKLFFRVIPFWHIYCLIPYERTHTMKTAAYTKNIPQKTPVAYPGSQDRIAAVAREFESLFTSMMLKSMRKTVGENELLPSSMGEKIYTDMLDDEYAKTMGSQSTLGLAALVEKELRKQQGDLPDVGSLKTKPWMIDNKFITPRTAPQGSRYSAAAAQLARKVSPWDSIITAVASEFKVDKNLVSAVVAQESGGNQYAVSRAGAKGLMQLIDSTAKDMGVSESFNPVQNIRGGVKYLRTMLDKFDGNEKLALAAYNAGPTAVTRYQGIPPYRETMNYVTSVQRIKNLFAQEVATKE